MDQRLKHKTHTIKLLEENTGKKLVNTGFGHDTKAQRLGRTGFHVILVEKSVLGFPSESRGRQFMWVILKPINIFQGNKNLK